MRVAIGRPSGARVCSLICQARYRSPVSDIQTVDVKGIVVAPGCKGDRHSVRRPGWMAVVRRVIGQIDGIRAIGIHNVDFIVSIAIAREGDLGVGCRPRADMPRSP